MNFCETADRVIEQEGPIHIVLETADDIRILLESIIMGSMIQVNTPQSYILYYQTIANLTIMAIMAGDRVRMNRWLDTTYKNIQDYPPFIRVFCNEIVDRMKKYSSVLQASFEDDPLNSGNSMEETMKQLEETIMQLGEVLDESSDQTEDD